MIDADGAPGGQGDAHLVLVHFDPMKPVAIERGENKGTTITYANPVTGIQTAGMWHGKAGALRIAAQRDRQEGRLRRAAAVGEQGWPARPDPRRRGRSRRKPRRPDAGQLPRTAAKKNRCQLASDTGHSGFWDRRTRLLLRKTEVGSIRRRPVGGGLGVYEPVPDRTVSGNSVNSSDIGASARIKNGSNVAQHHQSYTECFRLLPICD